MFTSQARHCCRHPTSIAVFHVLQINSNPFSQQIPSSLRNFSKAFSLGVCCYAVAKLLLLVFISKYFNIYLPQSINSSTKKKKMTFADTLDAYSTSILARRHLFTHAGLTYNGENDIKDTCDSKKRLTASRW